jgi:integrase
MARISKREWKSQKDGKAYVRWDAQLYVGRHPATHKPQFLSKTFERRTDAEAWARKLELMKDEGGRPATTKETLGEYLERWLLIHAGQVRDVTVYNYRASLNRWVLKPSKGVPPIGSIRLSKLPVQAFDQLYAYMLEQGIEPRGIEYVHGILKRALKEAVRKGTLPRNPTEFATLPKQDHAAEEDEEAVVRALDREQADRFLDAARENRHAALWHVLLTGGLRPCEAFALKWLHVDFVKGEVHVRRTLSRVGLDRKEHPTGWKLTKPKTPKSSRVVPLPDLTMRELRAWKVEQAKDRLALGPEWQDHGFVFTTEVGSPLDGSNLYRTSFRE